jgi:NitT/TauT family transport system permease protein
MNKKFLIRLILGLSPFIIVLGAWIFLTEGGYIKDAFLPSIPNVFTSLFKQFTGENYLLDVWVSIYRVMLAFVISAILAVPIGLFTGYSKKVAELVEPFVGFARYLPVPALVPLCILWFGLGHESKIAIIFLGTFFQLILMVADVARDVPKTYFEAALTLGGRQWQLIRKVLLPASLPGVVNACRTAVGWAWTYLVVAEIAGATSGLGFRIMEAQRFIQSSKIFAGILVIGLLGLITDLLFQYLYKYMFTWLES